MHKHPQLVARHAELVLDGLMRFRPDRSKEGEMRRVEVTQGLDGSRAGEDSKVLVLPSDRVPRERA